AVLTRWMSHYLALRQLMELKSPLTVMAEQEFTERKIITGEVKSRVKAEKMLKLIKNPTFW
ncbi:hypothetical protein PAXRUDRAFT_95838, partial [Paxillus rubicundulus Ve08.2h10]